MMSWFPQARETEGQQEREPRQSRAPSAMTIDTRPSRGLSTEIEEEGEVGGWVLFPCALGLRAWMVSTLHSLTKT